MGEPVNLVTITCGDRFNPIAFCNITHRDDSKLPADEKAVNSLVAYKKKFKVENVTDIPKVEFKELKTKKEVETPHCIGSDYIVYKEKDKADYDGMVEYDCDEEDYLWMDLANERRLKRKEKEITTDSMELVMDRFEKESVFEMKNAGTLPSGSVEEDDLCCICGDGDVSNVNQIIYCDMCNIAVHQECYGVPYIPEGQWLCRRCKLSPSQPVKCCLCPNTSGAFKQTSDGRWAHVICSIWLNEVHFGNAVFLEPVEGIDLSLRRRSKLKCLVCRQKMGACLQCSTRSCLKAFHVTCAQQSGMTMEVKAIPDSSDPDGMNVQRYVFCHLHMTDDASDAAARRKRMGDAIRNARRSMADTHRKAPAINMPHISPKAVEKIGRRVGHDVSDILQYWHLKRKSRCGVPLIRRLQLNQKVSRVSISHDTMDETEKNVYSEFMKKRCNLETARLLSEQVKKREAHKHDHITCSMRMFETVFAPLSTVMDRILSKLFHKDREKIFHQPVSLEGYSSIIKRPMDMSTMSKKVANGKYASLADLKSDFDLMMNNCQEFNLENEWYLTYGRRMENTGEKIFDEAQQLEKRQKDIDKMIAANDAMIAELSRIMFTESEYEESKLDSESEVVKPHGRLRRGSVIDTPVAERRSTRRERRDDKEKDREKLRDHDKSCKKEEPVCIAPAALVMGFLTPRESASKLLNGNSRSTTKRKTDTDITSIGLKNKKKKLNGIGEDDSTLYPLRQSTMKQFLAATPISVRSTRSHGGVLNAYRDNGGIKSPLPADVASSESSSTEDDDGIRPNRRTRSDAKLDAQIQESSDSECFHHNDLVVVNGYAGRVIDPVRAPLEELPKPLIGECRAQLPKNEHKVCVYLFDEENKWTWNHAGDVRLLNNGHDPEVHAASMKLAKQWKKRVLDTYR